jgi:hypothetical protein
VKNTGGVCTLLRLLLLVLQVLLTMHLLRGCNILLQIQIHCVVKIQSVNLTPLTPTAPLYCSHLYRTPPGLVLLLGGVLCFRLCTAYIV